MKSLFEGAPQPGWLAAAQLGQHGFGVGHFARAVKQRSLKDRPLGKASQRSQPSCPWAGRWRAWACAAAAPELEADLVGSLLAVALQGMARQQWQHVSSRRRCSSLPVEARRQQQMQQHKHGAGLGMDTAQPQHIQQHAAQPSTSSNTQPSPAHAAAHSAACRCFTCRTRSGSWAATPSAAARSHPSFRCSSHSSSGWPAFGLEGASVESVERQLHSGAPPTPRLAGLHSVSDWKEHQLSGVEGAPIENEVRPGDCSPGLLACTA